MQKGISLQGCVPMRREPSEVSEMVSQVLFGETFHILESNEKWLLISLDSDGYQGWVSNDSVQLAEPENGAKNKLESGFRMVSIPLITLRDLMMARQQVLPAGSILPGTSGNKVQIYDREFELLSGEGIIHPGTGVDPEEVGKGLLSLPYLWGGRSGFGFDCSGLTQMLCRMIGVSIPREIRQQAELGSAVNFMHEIKKGDLAFFDNSEGEISHVGMVLDGSRILHSSIRVRIDKLDQHGIFCEEKRDYTHKLRIIKRVERPD